VGKLAKVIAQKLQERPELWHERAFAGRKGRDDDDGCGVPRRPPAVFSTGQAGACVGLKLPGVAWVMVPEAWTGLDRPGPAPGYLGRSRLDRLIRLYRPRPGYSDYSGRLGRPRPPLAPA